MEKNNTKSFIKTLDKTLMLYKNSQIELKKVDFLIIQALRNCMNDIISFKMPYKPENYKTYESKATKDIDDLDISTSFEFYFNNYTKDVLFSKSLENSIPFILVLIKKSNLALKRLEKTTGSVLDGDLLFLVRKQNDKWELPIRALIMNTDRIDEVVLFKPLDYRLDLKKSSELLENSRYFYKNEILELYEKYKKICFSEVETFKVSENKLIYPDAFSVPDTEINDHIDLNLINENLNKLFKFNLIYDFSIALSE